MVAVVAGPETVTVTFVGADGTSVPVDAGVGVTDPDGEEATERPAEFRARTVKETATAFVKPVTLIGDDVPVADWPVEAVTV